MTDRLLIFQQTAEYSTESDTATGSFDVSLYADLLDCDVGYALTIDDQPLSEYYVDRLEMEVLDIPWRSVASGFHERFVVTDPAVFSEKVKLRNGDRVRIDEYDTVFVTQVVFHTAYVHYVAENFEDLTVIGLQDESLQDIMNFSAELELHHMRSLTSVDGFISEDEQYRRWASTIVDDIHFVPLLIPDGHFDDVQATTSRSREKVCLGSATHNHLPSNFYSSIAVFDSLRDIGHEITGEILGVTEWQRPELDEYEQREGVATRGFMEGGFYDYIGQFDLAILPTARVSAGRISAEFAAVGVPCIGNAQNDLQRRCFPDLTVAPYDTPAITSLAHRLLTDDVFYESIVRRAQRAVADLQDHRTEVERLRRFVRSVEHRT
jgi:hypothetical protein